VHWRDFGHPSRLANYASKRAIRIYPTYWLIFAVVYWVAAATVGGSVRLDMPTLLKTLALIPQSSLDPIVGTSAPILGVAWTLQYEILFYGLMAFFIVSRPIGSLLAALVILNLLACRAHSCVLSAPWLQTNLILLFGLGALAAICCKLSGTIKHAWVLAGIGAVAFLATGIWDDVSGERLTLAYGLSSAAIVVGLVKAEDRGSFRIKWDWPVLLGDASYALYLIHFPLVVLLCKIAVRSGLHGLVGAVVAVPVILAACVAAAIGFSRLIERPLLRALAGGRNSTITLSDRRALQEP
jgi:exopolysaccharide production protein ExoZ